MTYRVFGAALLQNVLVQATNLTPLLPLVSVKDSHVVFH